MIRRVALLMLFVWLSTPALGAGQHDLANCLGGPKIAVATQISACTALVKDGRLQPKDVALAYLKRGNAFGSIGKLDLAIADFTEAIRLDAEFFEAHANRGLAYARQRRFDRAIPDYNRALTLNADVKVIVNRGAAYDALGNHDAALRDVTYAISKRPDDYVLYSVRGLTHLAKGDNALALADYDRALTLKPDDGRTLGQRCWALAVTGKKLERALSDCDESLRLRRDLWRARASRAFVYFRLNRFDEAIADATAVTQTEPKFADAFYVRGLAKGRKGDRKGSVTDIAAAKALNPKIVDEYAGYGIAKP